MRVTRAQGKDLHPQVRFALAALKNALAANHPEMAHVQVTLDELHKPDHLPTVDYLPSPPLEVARHPFPGDRPEDAREIATWRFALKRDCPRCGEPAGKRCINMAPSHRKAKVAYETRSPHPERLRS